MNELIVDPNRKWVCPQKGCSNIYMSLYSMKRHYTSSHDPIRKFVCDVCGQRFALHQYLKEHLSIHSGAKPFKCKIGDCPAAFTQAGKLSAHKKMHSMKIF